jgi:glutaredoxin
MRMEIKIGGKVLLIIIILIVIGIVGVSVSGYFVNNGNNSGKYDNFAKCLAQKDATMYGAEWCSHCKQQKDMFGASFKYVNYVECPDNQAFCDEKGITGYPTWIINGLPYQGTQSFEKLSELTGCPVS